ncbi:protein phosphatase CheZ [Mangrovimicrobium sediminis]|uniref:Protein phosphatase CheZ n=1 Tax=Mangrovimicrobium sediminis TaxID=2562682 RepID=A0A4Z0M1C9_9GAMM|nr:protein phosphatase CheZ [Haliea sp. SAOS-164]TGD73168.1 protein phosphatase CheZ [Haliea sp. SAOS-164]
MQSAQEVKATPPVENVDEFVGRVGNLIRNLRENIKALGVEGAVQKAAEIIPDARGRLSYIANMTEEAAERALNAVDRAQPIQDELEARSQELSERWTHWFGHPLDDDAVRSLVLDTRQFLEQVPKSTAATNQELLEITMAQDFQDLTGQVIKKLMELVVSVEHQLLDLLVDSLYPEESRDEVRARIYEQSEVPADDPEQSLLNGPQVDPTAADVVSSQDQVDDLLDELGF